MGTHFSIGFAPHGVFHERIVNAGRHALAAIITPRSALETVRKEDHRCGSKRDLNTPKADIEFIKQTFNSKKDQKD